MALGHVKPIHLSNGGGIRVSSCVAPFEIFWVQHFSPWNNSFTYYNFWLSTTFHHICVQNKKLYKHIAIMSTIHNPSWKVIFFSTRIHKFILSRSSMPSRHTEVWPPDLLHEEITWPQGEVEYVLREATKMKCQRNLGIPKVVKKSRDSMQSTTLSIRGHDMHRLTLWEGTTRTWISSFQRLEGS